MTFKVQPLVFEFKAKDPVHFPPGKAANTLRGALGQVLSQQIFEPKPDSHPSGLADSPRPFVFRARHLDGVTVAPGEQFHFQINLFNPELTREFISAVEALAHEGLGAQRAGIELLRAIPNESITLNLNPRPESPSRIRVHFLSPTELKHEGKVVETPEFPILFARIRDRISTLRSLYAEAPLNLDFKASNERAVAVKMTSCNLNHQEIKRRSSRTGQTHSIGGFTGTAEYEGDLAEFMPWLEAALWTGVGRQAVWGKGEIETRAT